MKEGLKSEIVRVHTPCNFNVKQYKDRSKCHKYKYSSIPYNSGFSLGSTDLQRASGQKLKGSVSFDGGEILYFH